MSVCILRRPFRDTCVKSVRRTLSRLFCPQRYGPAYSIDPSQDKTEAIFLSLSSSCIKNNVFGCMKFSLV